MAEAAAQPHRLQEHHQEATSLAGLGGIPDRMAQTADPVLALSSSHGKGGQSCISY